MSGLFAYRADPSQLIGLNNGPFRAAWLIPDEKAQAVDIEIIFQSGEADSVGPEGLAHYVEHLSWLNAHLDASANTVRHANAWTVSLATGYSAQATVDTLDKELARLLLVTKPLKVDQTFAREERDIVLREYDLNFRDDDFVSIYHDIDKALYNDGPLARSVIGTPESIGKFTLEDAAALRDETHKLDNAVLLVTGNISAKAVNDAVAALGLATAEITAPPFPNIAPATPLDDRQTVRVKRTTPQTLLDERLTTVADCDAGVDCFVQVTLLREILLSARAGSLSKPLRFDTFTAQSLDFWMTVVGPNHLRASFSARPDVGVTLDELSQAYDATLADIIKNGIPQDTFDKAKSELLKSWERNDAIPATVMADAVQSISDRNTPYAYSQAQAALEATKVPDLNSLLQNFGGETRHVVRYVLSAE